MEQFTQSAKKNPSSKKLKRHLMDLGRILQSYQWLYLSSALLLMTSILFRTFEPKILQLAVDHVIQKIKEPTAAQEEVDFISQFFIGLLPEVHEQSMGLVLALLGLFYVSIAIFRSGSLFAANTIKANCAEHVTKDLRDTAFSHIQHLPLDFFTNITRGELIQRCTGDIDKVKRFLRDQIIAIVRILSIFFFSFFMMMIVNWKFALVSIVMAPAIAITAYLFFKKEKQIWKEHEEESDKLNNMVQENLNGIRMVSAYSNQQHEISRFKQQNIVKRQMGIKHNLLHTYFWPVSDFMAYSQLTISMLVGGYYTVMGQITIGELLSFYTYIGMVTWPMRSLGRVLSEIGVALIAMDRISEILDASKEKMEGYQVEHFQGHIEFVDVSFQYHPEEAEVLSHISFKVQAGERVAIIGPTGSGKSTLIRLLMRLYEPTQGQILLDHKPIQTYGRGLLREKIGLALQRAFLFSTTVRNNIAYTSPEASDETVQDAAGIAQIREVETIFADGYQTLVGEKGVTLSGGQKQRVALARTILSQPDILILDDITSAVDTETEQAIFQALAEPMGQKTTLIISHRITSIQQADRVLVMESGKIVQQGTPESLASEPGYYRDILLIQQAVEQEISNINPL